MGWGGAVTALAAGGGFGLGSAALNPLTSAFLPSLGDGSAGSTHSGAAPTAAPRGTGIGRDSGAGATGQLGNVGAARRPPSACDVGMCLAQSTPGGVGAPGYEIRNDGTGGGVPVEQRSEILDQIVSFLGRRVAAAVNLVMTLEEHRAAYVAQMAARKVAGTGTDASQTEKEAVRQENRDAHGGNLTCENCGRDDLADPQRARGGVARPENEAQVDHVVPKGAGGLGKRPNLRVLCPSCNKPGVIPR